jgi:hypothetical protein
MTKACFYTMVPNEQAAKVTPFAAGNKGVVCKSAAGDFCQVNQA